MSFGTFSTSLQGVYSWGVLRTAQFAGMVMDIDRIGATIVDKDNKQSNLLAFTQQQGPRQSLNENLVPEQFFNDPNSTQKNVEGVSATKILKLANDQGQNIYYIDQSNINIIIPQLNHDSSVISDIRNAVAAGKVVTISEKSINFNGWKGSGYIITDPNTGSGAYLVNGGLNGGVILGIIGAILILTAMWILTSFAVAGLIFLGSMILILGLVLYLSFIAKAMLLDDVEFSCAGFLLGVTAATTALGWPGLAATLFVQRVNWIITVVLLGASTKTLVEGTSCPI